MADAVKSFHDLEAWQKAMELMTIIYQVSQKFPKEALYNLTCQLRRDTIYIPSSIAEGQGMSSPGEFQQFISQARDSLAEVETQIISVSDLGYLEKAEFTQIMELIAQVGKLLQGLLSSILKTK